jgi:hypothetical protein
LIDAEIRKKIRHDTIVSRQEDILTSNIFGLMRMVPDHLIGVLVNAKHIVNNEKLVQIGSSSIAPRSFELWKKFQNKNKETSKLRDEPDVYFELESSKKIIVEVKYLSGESDENQLIDYAEHCDYLIYLTFFNDHHKKAKEKYSHHEKIYLLTWKEFHNAIRNIPKSDSLIESALLLQVSQYLDYKFGSIWDGWADTLGSTTYLHGGFYNGKRNEYK